MIDSKKLKRAIETQKEIIINNLIEKSNNGNTLEKEELQMLENYYDTIKEV